MLRDTQQKGSEKEPPPTTRDKAQQRKHILHERDDNKASIEPPRTTAVADSAIKYVVSRTLAMSIFWATLSAVVSECTPAGASDPAVGATWTVPNPPDITLKMFLPPSR